jgi:hypothetical protein
VFTPDGLFGKDADLRSVNALFLVAVLAGCANLGVNSEIVVMEGNYITFRNPFTDAGQAEVRRRAEQICAGRKQAAYLTESVCSLTTCRTSYQCMSSADAAKLNQ